MRIIKVIHVHLIFERRNYYFGSISAIYETLDESVVGIKENTLLHSGLGEGSCIPTRRAIIRQSHLIRCKRRNTK